uniref:UDP-N-acetylglucosamine diphosphorylase n=1 Tax=Tetraselmis sp. GSL018 TaxID=582737 RepID=A0A061SNA9_9CHLO
MLGLPGEGVVGKLTGFSVLVGTAWASARAVVALGRRVRGNTQCRVSGKAVSVPEQCGSQPPKDFIHLCRKHRQEHVLESWDHLSDESRKELLRDVADIDLDQLANSFERSMALSKARGITSEGCSEVQVKLVDGAVQIGTEEELPEPVANVKMQKDITRLENIRWVNLGYALIAQGKLGVIILAGGQGTRLGSSAPKGCYDIGLPSKKSLFQLQAERVRRVQQLAAAAYYNTRSIFKKVHVYIMTSPMTDEPTRAHFRENNFFGLTEDQVHFFMQGTMPCVDKNGRLIMETPSKVARAPNGNGGLFTALAKSGCLEHMKHNGIHCVDVNCIDNVLVRVADPLFNGYCWEIGADCGCRTLAKANAMEKVGVFVQQGEGIGVREYSEMPTAALHDLNQESGALKYNWSNICMHHFSVAYLSDVAAAMEASPVFHVAYKKIPSVDGEVQGIKLEQFIFDPFPSACRPALFEVKREEEFAPVKNAANEDMPDSPETARAAVLKLHRGWIEAAKGKVRIQKGPSEGVEVSPLLSYGGEGLEHLCQGKVFRNAYDVLLQGLAPLHMYRAAAAKAARAHEQSSQDNPFKRMASMFNRTTSDLF